MSVSITRAIRIARSSAASSWCNLGGGGGGNAHNHRLLMTQHLLTTPRFRLSTTSIQQRQKHLSINPPRSNNNVMMTNNSLLLRCTTRRLSSSSSSSQTTNRTTAATQADNSTPLSSASITFGKIFFPSLCAITFTLGIWQTKRYFEKLDMVSKRKYDLMLDPMTFDEWTLKNDAASISSNNAATTLSTSSYRRVTLHGKFDHTNTILIGPRGPPPGALATSGPNSGLASNTGGMSSSQQGYWVVTPLIIIGDERSNSSISVDSDDAIGEGGEKKKNKSWWLHRILLWKGHRGSSSSSSGSTLSLSTQNGTNSYNTASPSSSSNNNTSKTAAAAAANTVWINRGWIPRHFINQVNNQIIQSWDEPSDMVTLQTMESQTERGGGMFTPPSRLDSVSTKGGEKGASSSNNSNSSSINNNDGRRSVRKLLWMDREAMEQMTSCNENQHPPLFVQINTEDNNHQLTTTAATATTTTTTTTRSYPVRPSQEYVGEFKVTPEVHAGYAVTWFGLSGAGVIMTRKLLTRGR
jgi:cytochrome oxidase assembly protein ShyY1